MHKNFADWYSLVSIRHAAPTLEARWSAIEDLSDRLTVTQVPDLIRVFFSFHGGDQLRNEIRQSAKAKDPTYLFEGDDNEVVVLAGGVIAKTVEDSSDLADAIALAVACVDAQGLRKSKRLQGVVDDTTRYFSEESVRVRKVDVAAVSDFDSKALMKRIAEKRTAAIASAEATWTAFEAALKDMLDTYKEQTSNALNHTLDRQREESDILWWLFSEHTVDGTKPFSKLTVGEACCWGARDLATLTRTLPGPFAAPAFLRKMLTSVNKKLPGAIKISDAVNACDKDWKHSWVSSLRVTELPELCPILFAITKSDEVGERGDWTAAFENTTELKANQSLAPARLAVQVYNELLLLRALAAED